jgi:peptidoglycan/LPS O-acetylase OafA/YrhL
VERSQTFLQAFCHLTLLFGIIPHALLPEATATFLPPAWSISLEWQFYLFAILITQYLRSIRFVFLLGVIGCAGVWYARFWQNPHIAFLPAQLPLFLMGIGSYHLYSRIIQNGSPLNPAYAVAVVVAASIMSQWHWVAVSLWALILGTLFANQDDWFSRWLQALRRRLLHPWLQLLGRISYPLYLVHWPMIILLMFGILHWRPQVTSLQALVLMLILGLPCILLAAWLLHITVEMPLMKLGKRKNFRANQAKPLTNGSANP